MSVVTARRGTSSPDDRVQVQDEPSWTTDILDCGALGLVAILALLTVAGGPVPVREVLALGVLCYVPGRAFATHWTWLQGAPLALLTVVGGLAVTTLLATTSLWLHWWSPTLLFWAEAAGGCASILWGLTKRRKLHGQTRRLGEGRHVAVGRGRWDLRAILGVWRDRHGAGSVGSRASNLSVNSTVRRPMVTDFLLVLSIALFSFGVGGVQLGRINRWGLLPALPVAFYAGFATLVVSIIWLLNSRKLSSPRLFVHLLVLVVMIAGTPALAYPVPRYPWLYKHIGVVQNFNLHGAVNQSIDIYQNWPGFFALVALFDRASGASSPIRFAAWSETVVMLISCLALYTAAKQLRMTVRERWIGLFIFVVASWVDQVYFSPQAFAYALSLTVLALVLCWYQHDDSARWVLRLQDRAGLVVRRLRPTASTNEHPHSVQPSQAGGAPPALLGIGVMFVIYGVLVFVHQLSPYIVALQISVLTILGRVRPRWLMVAMWALAIGYLLPRFSYVNKAYGLLNSFGSFFSNTQTSATAVHRPYDLGVRVAAYAADAITLLVWSSAVVGVFRRLRAGRPTMALSVLAFSPLITFFLTNYGGEAEYRVYFFSVPWVSLLAASAFASEKTGRSVRSVFAFSAVFAMFAALIFPAYLGDDEIYVTPPSEVAAANYFYSHAQPGSALILAAPDFPGRVSGRYDEYLTLKNEVDPNLLNYPQFGSYQPLGAKNLSDLRDFALSFANGGQTKVYIAFAASGFAAAQAYNLAPPGALASLESAMKLSPEWSVYLTNPSTTIFLFNPSKPATS